MNKLECEDILLKQNKKYEIKESPINGLGVFSLKNFKKGDYINIHGIMMSDYFEITKFGKYLNHSYSPNAITKVDWGVYETYALKNIKIGDEITLDYRKLKRLEQPEKDWI